VSFTAPGLALTLLEVLDVLTVFTVFAVGPVVAREVVTVPVREAGSTSVPAFPGGGATYCGPPETGIVR